MVEEPGTLTPNLSLIHQNSDGRESGDRVGKPSNGEIEQTRAHHPPRDWG